MRKRTWSTMLLVLATTSCAAAGTGSPSRRPPSLRRAAPHLRSAVIVYFTSGVDNRVTRMTFNGRALRAG